jgi:beta-galactosidase
VFLNGKFIDTVYRDGGNWTVDLPPSDSSIKRPTLDILVEAMGRVNYGQFMIDRKGITDKVTLNGMVVMNWLITPIPMDYENIQSTHDHEIFDIPSGWRGFFFKSLFNLDEIGDTYFDLSAFSKGIVYINGHNLGRYWKVGPQHRLYCPASWLKKGENEIILFDLHQLTEASITGHKTPAD